MTRPSSFTSILVTCASVTTFSRPVFCARGMVVTLGPFLASTWQPPRLQKPWYMHGERSWKRSELIAAGPGKGCQPNARAAAVMRSR